MLIPWSAVFSMQHEVYAKSGDYPVHYLYICCPSEGYPYSRRVSAARPLRIHEWSLSAVVLILSLSLFQRCPKKYSPGCPLLPSATVVEERLCVYTCLSAILFTGGGVHTPLWPDTPPGQTPPPQQTTTAADCTHPTGMHSC